MEVSEFNKVKRKILIVQSIALLLLIIMSFLAYPYIWSNFDCNKDIGKLTCEQATFAKYFAVLFTPLLLVSIMAITIFFPVKEREKEAAKPNLKRLTKIMNTLAIFLVIVQPFNLSLYFMTKEMFNRFADDILTGVYILMSLFFLYIANMTGKMSKSLISGWPTPWNLKSEFVWEKTQRFMGFALTIVAILCFIGAFVWRIIDYPMLVPAISIGGMIVAYIISFILSYYLYQQEKLYQENSKNNG